MLAPLLAGRPRVRESRTGGHTYLRRWERPLTARLPAVPAAVPIYSAAGDTRVLVIDLDASRGGRDAVRRDAAAVTDLVRAAGGRVIVDESPSGGRHVYVPLAVPVGFHDARDLALALAVRTPSMDPSPNQNLTDGLIRPPGSVHPSGGHQVLHGPLTAAQQLAATGNPPAVLDRLRGPARDGAGRRQATHTGHGDPTAPSSDGVDGAPHLPRASGPRELAADYLRIATTGLYDTDPVPVPVRGPAGRARGRGVRRPDPAAGPDPDRHRGVAGVGVLLHPLPAPAAPGGRRCSRTGATPWPSSPADPRRTPRRALSVNPPQASHPHTGGHPAARIKINNCSCRREGRSRSTGGCGPGGPHFRCWSTTGTATGPASAAAGCCARWVRRR